MKKYLVSFMKNGELFETIVTANNSFDARECISIKYEIPILKLEIMKMKKIM